MPAAPIRRLHRTPNPQNALLYLFFVGSAFIGVCSIDSLSLPAVGVAIGIYYLTFGIGFSGGIHRGLIHGSYRTSRAMEYLLALLGSLAGLGGPVTISRVHFIRDYFQTREVIDQGAYARSLWENHKNFLFTRMEIVPPPDDPTTDRIARDPFYRFLENRILLQFVLALILYAVGGVQFVVWGVLVRVAFTVNMFSMLDHFGHVRTSWGYENHANPRVLYSGQNTVLLGWLLLGEGWHNNHHARPGSASFGLRPTEIDLVYLFLRLAERLGLVWDLTRPHSLAPRMSVQLGFNDADRTSREEGCPF